MASLSVYFTSLYPPALHYCGKAEAIGPTCVPITVVTLTMSARRGGESLALPGFAGHRLPRWYARSLAAPIHLPQEVNSFSRAMPLAARRVSPRLTTLPPCTDLDERFNPLTNSQYVPAQETLRFYAHIPAYRASPISRTLVRISASKDRISPIEARRATASAAAKT